MSTALARERTEARPLPRPEPDEVRALEEELRDRVRGEVRFDAGSRALYSTDASNYRHVPIGVVVPRDLDDVSETIAAARRHGAPILARGGGTSLAGQCCNVAVVIDMSKYLHHVLEIDPERRLARVQPGTILDTLRGAAAPHQLTYGPDPATHDHCTLGGMIGNNSCGVHGVLSEFYGPGPTTADHVVELDVQTYDGLRMRVGGRLTEDEIQRLGREPGRRGDIYRRLAALRDKYADEIRRRYPKLLRRVSGYNLPALLPENGFDLARALVGSECTLVTILEAAVSLIPEPKHRALLVAGFDDIYTAGDHVMDIRERRPTALEGIDQRLVTFMKRKGLHPDDAKLLPEGGAWLFVEFGGDTAEEAAERARDTLAMLQDKVSRLDGRIVTKEHDKKKLWEVRESGLGATAFVPGEPAAWPGWEDSAVPVERVGEYLRELRRLFDRHGFAPSLYGHLGQGCIHCRVEFDLVTAKGIDQYRAFTLEAAHLVTRFGGSLSGEHGDGQSRGELLPIMFGDTLVEAMREFKAIWDPDGMMNPGKIVDARPRTADLRLGADYRPPTPKTYFHYPDDDGSFSHATMRCVGVGKCRRLDGGTMCPSFMALREEKHATRGRARLLFEMLEGTEIQDGWRSEAVKESLDLCLACKGCKSDCPVNVDMATYKAEFFAHYYEGRLRPRHAYAFGLIDRWARLASLAPRLANLATGTPGLATIAKLAAGMTLERPVPKFANETFTHWFRHRTTTRRDGDPVLLWPDTFNNHFHPETAQAAVEVLEAAGCTVLIPSRTLCCGRPLYDFGMLDRARAKLEDILAALRPQIEAGIPVVGLEPSCVAVFRDELGALLPHDADAKRLGEQSFLLGEFLHRRGYEPPPLPGKALVHGHCHQKSVLDMRSETALLAKLGLDVEMPESGCCGMAGSFGFAPDKYDVSLAVGERALLPAVRAADEPTLVIANGFSCRTQIADLTERRALHLADVLAMALRRARPADPTEAPIAAARSTSSRRRGAAVVSATLAATALGALAWYARAVRTSGAPR